MKNFFTRPNYLGYFQSPFIALQMRDLFGACERAIAGSLGAFLYNADYLDHVWTRTRLSGWPPLAFTLNCTYDYKANITK